MPLALAFLLVATSSPLLTIPPDMMVDQAEVDKTAWMQKLQDCENYQNKFERIVDSNGYYSYGPFMYQMGTWLKYGKQFGATKENIHDHELQWKVTRWVLDNVGWQADWVTCGKRTVAKLGAYPD